MAKKHDRLSMLAEFLKDNKAASIRELSERFEVSMMTIRRDVETLVRQDVVRYFHGSVAYNREHMDVDEDSVKYILQKQRMIRKEEKLRIAQSATSFVEPNQTVMLDSGTTMYYLAQEISNVTSVTVVCWSLNVIEVLTQNPECSLISSGGLYHSETQMFESTQGIDLIRSARASVAFISAGGIHPELGVTTPFQYETEYKKMALGSSTVGVLLADSTKFGHVCTSHVAEIDDFDIIITDSGLSSEFQKSMAEKNIQVIIV